MKVGTREEWLAARVALRAVEKELTRRSDELARTRQDLPWVASRTTTRLCISRRVDRTPKGHGGDPEGWPGQHDEYDGERGAS